MRKEELQIKTAILIKIYCKNDKIMIKSRKEVPHMKKSKMGLRIVSMALALSIILTAIPTETVLAKEIEHEQLTDSSELWIPEHEPPLPNTEGDLPWEELATAVLPDADKSEVISDDLIAERDHVNRLWEQEEDLNTIIFQNRDGTKTMYWFDQPVKYVDENGEVKDKKNELTEQGNDYTNTENDINSYFPKKIHKNKGVVLRYNDIEIEIAPLINGSSGASRQTGHNKDGKATDVVEYPNVFDKNISVRYTPTFEGFKEDIILKENVGINEFSFKIKTGGLSLIQDEGIYYLADPLTGEKIIQVGDIVIYDSKSAVDANGVVDTETETVDEPVKEEPPELTEEEAKALYFPEKSSVPMYTHRYLVKTVKEDSEYIITIVVDKAYLENADTVYPVTIDPSLTLQSSFSQDATIYSNYRVNEGYTPNMFVGNYSARYGGTCGVARSLVKFPGLFSNSTFKNLSSDRISKVLYIPRDTMCEGDPVWINCYSMTQNWSEDTVKCNSSIWNAYDRSLLDDNCVYYNHGTDSKGTGTGHWYPFNITKAVKDWKNGKYGGISNHYGIMLKASNESNAAKTFATNNYSSLSPNVIVEYDPSVTGIRLNSACKTVNVGWSGYVSATVYPSSAKNKTVYWTSSNPNVASVNYYTGLIRANNAGRTVITATTADGGYTARCTLTVSLTDEQLSEQIVLCFSLLAEYSNYAYLSPREYAIVKKLNSEEAAIAEQTELVQSIQLLNLILLENKLVKNSPKASRMIAQHILSGEKYDYLEQADITADIRNNSAVFNGVWEERNKKAWLELAQNLVDLGIMIPYVQIPASLILLGQGIVGKDFTGRQLAWWERALNITAGVAGTIEGVGLISSAIKNAKTVKLLDKLDDVAKIAGDHAASEFAYALRTSRISGRALNGTLDAALINKVKGFRGSFIEDLKEEGNVAFADVSISGLKKEWFAHSRIDTLSEIKPAGAVSNISLKPTNPVFSASIVGGYMRDVDTEYKILNDIAKALGNNTSAVGKIKLFTERPPCDSCAKIIQQFSSKYKNIVIEVVDNGHKLLVP